MPHIDNAVHDDAIGDGRRQRRCAAAALPERTPLSYIVKHYRYAVLIMIFEEPDEHQR